MRSYFAAKTNQIKNDLPIIVKTVSITLGILFIAFLSFYGGKMSNSVVVNTPNVQQPKINPQPQTQVQQKSLVEPSPSESPKQEVIKTRKLSDIPELETVKDENFDEFIPYDESLEAMPSPTPFKLDDIKVTAATPIRTPIIIERATPTPQSTAYPNYSTTTRDYPTTTQSDSTYTPSVSPNTSTGTVNPSSEYVNGYYRRDGTYVNGYNRTKRNSTKSDNYSTKGNTNPYTGKRGTRKP